MVDCVYLRCEKNSLRVMGQVKESSCSLVLLSGTPTLFGDILRDIESGVTGTILDVSSSLN